MHYACWSHKYVQFYINIYNLQHLFNLALTANVVAMYHIIEIKPKRTLIMVKHIAKQLNWSNSMVKIEINKRVMKSWVAILLY